MNFTNKTHYWPVLCLMILALSGCGRGPDWPAGTQVKREVEQSNYEQQQPPIHYEKSVLQPLAAIRVEARVLGVKRYRGPTGDIMPFDLALGWGPMSDTQLLDKLDISQGQRRYYYRWKAGQLTAQERRDITPYSANMHLIAGGEGVWDALKTVRINDHVVIEGQLVNVTLDGGQKLRTSVVRTDTWDGACEIIWVEKLQIIPQPGH